MPSGVYERTIEHRAKLSATLTGRPHTAEHRAKISAAFTPEKRGKLGALLTSRGPCLRPVWKNTALEAKLWSLLVNAGFTIELEKSFGRYRVDVYLPERHLAFEADGYWHRRPDRKEADSRRDAELMARFGLPIVRLTESDLLTTKVTG